MSLKRTLLASLLMLLTIGLTGYFTESRSIPPKKPLAQFPLNIGEWRGVARQFDQRIYDILGVDDSFLCDYVTPDGRAVELYVGYHDSQRKGDLIHSPKHCMPGGGWNITQASIETLALPGSNSGSIPLNKMRLERPGDSQLVWYWFQSRGRFIASEYMQKIYLVIDSITRRRTDGAFVRLIAPVRNGDREEAARNIKAFAQEVIPVLETYLPS